MHILYVEIQLDKIVIHSLANSEISDLDFSTITLCVTSAVGLEAVLAFAQTGSRQLGMERRIDLIFKINAQEQRGMCISDGFGFEFALGDHDSSANT